MVFAMRIFYKKWLKAIGTCPFYKIKSSSALNVNTRLFLKTNFDVGKISAYEMKEFF